MNIQTVQQYHWGRPVTPPMNGRGYLKSSKGTKFLNWDRKLTENNPVGFVFFFRTLPEEIEGKAAKTWERNKCSLKRPENKAARVGSNSMPSSPLSFALQESTLPVCARKPMCMQRLSSQLQPSIANKFEWHPSGVHRGHCPARWTRESYTSRCTKAQRQQLRGKALERLTCLSPRLSLLLANGFSLMAATELKIRTWALPVTHRVGNDTVRDHRETRSHSWSLAFNGRKWLSQRDKTREKHHWDLFIWVILELGDNLIKYAMALDR